MDTNDEPLRDFGDRFFRKALLNSENLREFLSDAVPDLAPRFDFSRVHHVPTQLQLPNWRRREADLLFEIPYRCDQHEQLALVCVLLEHQTRADPRMPLRMLLEATLYWERQWLAWERMPQPKDEFRLRPVFPIVLHTGSRSLGSARTIGDMLGEPVAFHKFAPTFAPIFWELSAHSPGSLLDADAAFMHVLAIVRVQDAEHAEFARIFCETCRRLEAVRGHSRVRWIELLQLIFGWVFHRRPRVERPKWVELPTSINDDDVRKLEVSNMLGTLGKSMYDEAYEEGARGMLF
ncbi:MAG: hypothetical protein EXS16_17125 [Gemmataceae bacterium]|nr:hypothetical protein [Gemmataceae bacterium]